MQIYSLPCLLLDGSHLFTLGTGEWMCVCARVDMCMMYFLGYSDGRNEAGAEVGKKSEAACFRTWQGSQLS